RSSQPPNPFRATGPCPTSVQNHSPTPSLPFFQEWARKLLVVMLIPVSYHFGGSATPHETGPADTAWSASDHDAAATAGDPPVAVIDARSAPGNPGSGGYQPAAGAGRKRPLRPGYGRR